MRFLMQVSFPLEPFNSYVKEGSAGSRLQKILADLKPEAAYFAAVDGGKRGGTIVVNLNNVSEIPKYAEPFFLQFNASVQFLPTMTVEDLGSAGLDSLGQKWK